MLGLVRRRALALAAVAIVGIAVVRSAPIGMFGLIRRRARALAAVAVVGHALILVLGESGAAQRDHRNTGRKSGRECNSSCHRSHRVILPLIAMRVKRRRYFVEVSRLRVETSQRVRMTLPAPMIVAQ